MSDAERQVVDTARELVKSRRWYLGLPDDRDLPDRLAAALEKALAALDAAEAGRE
ncbi:hypothetical protein [Methylobacterium hispanicum]|uniref:hypothetical protein n=1 Tax=Methylobacterium hispanicum TaxID=270350 RepID=UPI002F35D169